MKLNNEKAQKAWEDYKGFMASMGMDLEKSRGIEQAFKMGFSYGAASNKQAAPIIREPIEKWRNVPAVKETAEEQEVRKMRRRSGKKIEQDSILVKNILQRNGGPMQLKDITEAVNRAGGNWYPKSASGHMIVAMERIPEIKRVGIGLYEYQG